MDYSKVRSLIDRYGVDKIVSAKNTFKRGGNKTKIKESYETYFSDPTEEEYFDIMPAATITADLPDIRTSRGKDIAKNMAQRVASGQMSITDVPRSYQSYVEGEAKGAIPVRQAINDAAPVVAKGLAATAAAPYAIAGLTTGALGEAAAKGLQFIGEKAMPSALLNNIGMSSVAPYADAAAMSLWSAEAGKAAYNAAKDNKPLEATAYGSMAALPFVPAMNNAIRGVRNFNEQVKLTPEDLYDAFSSFLTKEEAAALQPTTGGSGITKAPLDRSEIKDTRDWLKRFNQTFVRRHHYDPIPLNLSENPAEAENAVKDLLHRHNRVVRGIDDFTARFSRITDYEQDYMKRLMASKGYNPDSKEDRLLFAATTYAPSFKGYGRAGIAQDLAYITPDGYLNTGKIFPGIGLFGTPSPNIYKKVDLFDPGNTATALGTHYASNSIGTGKGYTYNHGKIALLEYPFELGPDRNLWQYEADFPVFRDNGKPINDNKNYQMAVMKALYSKEGRRLPTPDIPRTEWLPYVSPSNMDKTDIDTWLSLGRTKQSEYNIAPGYMRQSASRRIIENAKRYLTGENDIGGHWDLDDAFDNVPASNTFKKFGLSDDILKDFKFYKDKGMFGFVEEPKTVGDYINNKAVFAVLEGYRHKHPSIRYQQGIASKIYKDINSVKSDLYKRLLGPDMRDIINSIKERDEQLLEEFANPERAEDIKSIIELMPGHRYLDATGANKKKADDAFSHFISVGPVGEEAANFIDWVDPSLIDPSEIGVITRQHYGIGADFLTRNTRASGGKIHIKPENRGKFTALKKRTGHSATWFKQHGTPAQKKMATFALNARKWKHGDGGPLDYADPDFIGPMPLHIEDDNMILRHRYAESTFNDKAYNNGSKAMGAYQITPVVYDEYLSRTGDKGDLNDPKFNRKVRDWYMNKRLNEFEMSRMGNPSDLISTGRRYAAYNAGPGSVRKALKKALAAGEDIDNSFGWLKYLPQETNDYVNFIVRGLDVPNSSKTFEKFRKLSKAKGFDSGGALSKALSEGNKDLILSVIQKIKAGK